MNKTLFLKPGREKSILRKHPWVFSGAVRNITGDPKTGDVIDVCDSAGTFLGRGAYSPHSAIPVRLWTFQDEVIEREFFRRKLQSAMMLRKKIFGGSLPDAFRLIHAESDALPGITCDIYGKYAVCQFTSAGADAVREIIADLLTEYAPDGVYERSDCDIRQREGLPMRTGLLKGAEPPEILEFQENGITFCCDVRTGHKTGFYLDQRMNRLAVQQAAADKEDVLNCFCYTGGFGLAACRGGAKHVINVDTSADALALARMNAERNQFSAEQFETVEADVFQYLRKCRDSRKTFDMIILDPPKFADSAAAVAKAARGYKDIALLAMKLLKPGGQLFTFSCSGAMDDSLFGKVTDSAAADAGIDFRIVQWLSQGPDHPVSAAFPEGRYLKGLSGYKI